MDEMHVALASEADVVAIVPATADILARLAQGRADDPPLDERRLLDSFTPRFHFRPVSIVASFRRLGSGFLSP